MIARLIEIYEDLEGSYIGTILASSDLKYTPIKICKGCWK